MQKSGFFIKIIFFFAELLFKVSARLSNHAVYKIGLNKYTNVIKKISDLFIFDAIQNYIMV
jgi:hypothetical protein